MFFLKKLFIVSLLDVLKKKKETRACILQSETHSGFGIIENENIKPVFRIGCYQTGCIDHQYKRRVDYTSKHLKMRQYME